eukprot:GHVU01107880.1.p1 GENE.GHVU01107880.1~~GHVU01107880.1.p1  ORF type:complete len:117 (-),score=22.50 GHVU01107880.1:429-737(-)
MATETTAEPEAAACEASEVCEAESGIVVDVGAVVEKVAAKKEEWAALSAGAKRQLVSECFDIFQKRRFDLAKAAAKKRGTEDPDANPNAMIDSMMGAPMVSY